MFTALAISVAAASAAGASRASTVTASAMPSENERPWRPLVAMPRTGMSWVILTSPSGTAFSSERTTPTASEVPGVRCSAMSPPSLT